MESDEEVTGPINLGNPGEFTIRQLAEKVVDLVGGPSGLTSNLVFEPLPSDDPTQRQPNIDKARELLGWQPKITLDEGLPRTVRYFRGLITDQ